MPRIKTLGWSQEFKSLDETTKAHGEDGDCVVKALTLLTGLPFEPAVPLREAIDTVNAYKVAEGDAMTLSISKRGRLKIEYTYGG